MCENFDYKVIKLQRVRIINISLKGLAVGKWRYLTTEEVKNLRAK
jgi:23S rRNA pseudouridine2604 synthase